MPSSSLLSKALLVCERTTGACSHVLEKICDVCIVGLGFVMLGTMGLAIVTRYTSLSPFLWTDEVARYAMIWCAFLGASSALKKGMFLRFDLLINALPESLMRWVGVVTDVLSLSFLYLFLSSGLTTLPFTFLQKSSALELPMFYPYMGIVTGCSIMGVHLFFHLFVELRRILCPEKAL